MQILLDGIGEILGQVELRELMVNVGVQMVEMQTGGVAPDSPVRLEASAVQYGLEEVYGTAGGFGILQRAGRTSFKIILRRFGAELGLANLDFRLLPLGERVEKGLIKLAQVLTQLWNSPVQIERQPEMWLLTIPSSPFTLQRKSETAICYYVVGLVQEYLSWVSGGKYYAVDETSCSAVGQGACILQISKKPLD
jgi:predicted hydrocarbon binding protein